MQVEKLDVDVASDETIQSATLERAWLERTGPVRAGTTVPLKVLLRTYRGETLSADDPGHASPPPRPPAPTRCSWPTGRP